MKKNQINKWQYYFKYTTTGESAIEDEDKVMIEEDEVVIKLIESNWSDWHSTTDDEVFEDMLSIISKSKIKSLVTSYNWSNYVLCLYIDTLLFVLPRPNVYDAYSVKNIRL